MGNGKLTDTMIKDGLWDAFNDYHMGITAENIAKKYSISREEQDEFALNSQTKARIAQENKIFDNEITPVQVIKIRRMNLLLILMNTQNITVTLNH